MRITHKKIIIIIIIIFFYVAWVGVHPSCKLLFFFEVICMITMVLLELFSICVLGEIGNGILGLGDDAWMVEILFPKKKGTFFVLWNLWVSWVIAF